LFAVAFDLRRLKVTGAPVPLVEGVSRAAGSTSEIAPSGGANFSFSNNGSLVYVPGPVSPTPVLRHFALTTRKGEVERLKLPAGAYATPRVSPDGKRLAFGNDDGKEGVVSIYDLSGTNAVQRLTFEGSNRFPVWAPDSKRIAFQSDRGGSAAIFSQPIDGGSAEQLTRPDTGTSHEPESWSPDGETLLFTITRGDDVSLWTLSLRDRTSAPFGGVQSSNPTGAVFSPNGRWVAYASTEGPRTTIHVQPFPSTGARYLLSAKGSPHHPRWSPDGSELFYNPRPRGLEVVRVTTHPTFGFGNPVIVPKAFQGGPPASRTSYDITSDGKFVGLISAGQTEHVAEQTDHVLGSLKEIRVVLNWFEDLKTRASAR
jgi:Tol biopolymer transport system component